MEISDGILQGDVNELSEILGLSARRVQQLESDKVVVSLGHGLYDFFVSIRAYCEFLRQSTRGTTTTQEEKEERIRLTKAKAGIAELNHAEMVGALLRTEAVRGQDYALARILRSNLESLPDRRAAELAGENDVDKVYKILAEEIRQSLDQIIESMASLEVDDARLDITRRETFEKMNDDTSETAAGMG